MHLDGRVYLIEQGEGDGGPAVGEDPGQSSDERDDNFGHDIAQGVRYSNTILQLRAGYELRPNLWLEAEYFSRGKDSDQDNRDLETTLLNVGVRWNVTRRREAL